MRLRIQRPGRQVVFPWCGAQLASAGASDRRRSGEARPVVVAILACLLVGGAAAGTLFGAGDDPPPATDAGIDPAALAERAVRHDPVCEPAGCVAWRSPLDDEVAAAGHGLVLLLGGREVRALDGASGAPQWTADLTDLTGGRSRPLTHAEGRVHLLDEELVLVGTDPVVVADPDRVVGVRLRAGG